MARVQNADDSIFNQLFVGASEACAEANVQLSLSEIFFQHQRGTVLGIYVLSTSIGTYLGPLIGGFVADRLGWRWIGWLSVITSSITIIVVYFTLEETLFDRSPYEAGCIDGVQETATPPSDSNEKSISSPKPSFRHPFSGSRRQDLLAKNPTHNTRTKCHRHRLQAIHSTSLPHPPSLHFSRRNLLRNSMGRPGRMAYFLPHCRRKQLVRTTVELQRCRIWTYEYSYVNRCCYWVFLGWVSL